MSQNLVLPVLAISFFFIATLYSSVGFGGGSSYLALLALFLPDFLQIKSAALLCNLVVVAGSSYLFIKNGMFDKKKFLPLALCSVPAAFLGAVIHLTQRSFFLFLGGVLIVSGVLLVVQLFARPARSVVFTERSWVFNIVLGSGTGFLSGLVGIGGGILLSPLLNLLRWDEARKIAALASFFILVNSVAGLLGQAAGNHLTINFSLMAVLLTAVFAGGQLGTRLGLKVIKPETVKGLTGLLVLYAGLKLFLQYSIHVNI